VARGDEYIDPRLAPKIAAMASGDRRARGPFDLTVMEMRVLEKLPLGMTNAEIGEALGIKENTVKTHMRTAMYKLKAKDRAHAAAIAVREGLG
jgi:DNA-binding NarL/FixJ family response regulator